MGTVHALGDMVGGAMAGMIGVQAGYDAAVLMLAAIAAVGGVLFWLARPASRDAAPR